MDRDHCQGGPGQACRTTSEPYGKRREHESAGDTSHGWTPVLFGLSLLAYDIVSRIEWTRSELFCECGVIWRYVLYLAENRVVVGGVRCGW